MTPERTRRATLGGIAALLTAGWVAGCTGDDGGTAPVVRATGARAFEPRELVVGTGETVVWVNRSSVPHTVTADADRIPAGADYFASGGFESERAARAAYPPRGGLRPDVSYRHTLRTPGTYEYVCLAHEDAGMRGRITVRAP